MKKSTVLKFLLGVAIGIFLVFKVYPLVAPQEPTPIPDYVIGSSQAYVRDGNECNAYRVYAGDNLSALSDDQLLAIFKDVTRGDGYYLRTLWFYEDRSLIYSGGAYDVMIDEVAPWDYEITRR